MGHQPGGFKVRTMKAYTKRRYSAVRADILLLRTAQNLESVELRLLGGREIIVGAENEDVGSILGLAERRGLDIVGDEADCSNRRCRSSQGEAARRPLHAPVV